MLCLPRRISVLAILTTALGPCLHASQADVPGPRIEAIRFWSFGDVTRIAVETHGEYKLSSERLENPPRLFFDLTGIRPPISREKGVQAVAVGDHLVRQIRVAETEPGVTRIVFDLEVSTDFSCSQLVNPERLMIELRPRAGTARIPVTRRAVVGSERIHTAPPITAVPQPIRMVRAPTADLTRVGPLPVLFPPAAVPSATLKAVLDSHSALPRMPAPHALNARVSRRAMLVADRTPPASKRVSRPPAEAIMPDGIAPAQVDRNRSLVRVFGLKIHKVVIDAGHGGYDAGTIGPGGLMEKDLVLDVAQRLGVLVRQRLGAEVLYTRNNDVFIPLEQRTQIANDEKADLFISVHANSSPAPSATGVETYYFNFTSDKGSIELATRENASSTSSIYELNDLLHRAVLNTKVEESRDFAQRVQSSLYAVSAKMNRSSKDRGVKKAPFVVLIGATMPSVLAEIAFVSNPHDEKLLGHAEQRQKIADALFKGISTYASSLSHVEMARAAN